MRTTKTTRLLGGAMAIALAAVTVNAAITPAAVERQPSAAAEQRRPNIVLITLDDASLRDAAVMHKTRARVRKQGVSFANMRSTDPLCCPARASILTGQYPHNHGVTSNNPETGGGFVGLDDSSTVATWLRTRGYKTFFTGKYLNGYGKFLSTRNRRAPQTGPSYVPPGWSHWRGAVDPTTYNYRGQMLNINGRLKRYRGVYATNLMGRVTRTFLNNNLRGKAPVFVWTSFVAPHNGGPIEPDDPKRLGWTDRVGTPAVAKPYRNLYDDRNLPADPSYDEPDVSDKPRHIRRIPRFDANMERTIEEQYQQRLESVRSVDDQIASIMATLRSNRALGNTYVIVTSDNGWLSGQHRWRGKIVPYEGSSRVFLYLRGPRVKARAVSQENVGTIDIAPTIVDVAGVRPGATRRLDGRSLVPFGQRPGRNDGRALGIEAGAEKVADRWFYRGVRTPRYAYYSYETQSPGAYELYDMRHDPHQLRSIDVAEQPRYRKVKRVLTRLANEQHRCRGHARSAARSCLVTRVGAQLPRMP